MATSGGETRTDFAYVREGTRQSELKLLGMPGDCGIKVRHPNAQVLDLPRSERAGSIRGGWFDWCAHCSLLAKVLKKPVGFFDCYGSEALQKCEQRRVRCIGCFQL